MNAKRSSLLVPSAVALLGLTVLLTLGIWQLERKAWKEALIATLDRRLAAAPVELPPPSEWAGMTSGHSEFTRVQVRIEGSNGPDALVYTSGSTLRDDVKSPGFFVFTPARLPSGRQVVINRGYVPNAGFPGAPAPQEIVGALRWPEASSWFIADHFGKIWYVRDHRLMAKALGWGEVAPFYIEQEAPVPPGGLPHPAALNVRLRNDHLQYALTWFGLAAVLVVVFAVWAATRRREVILDRTRAK